MYVTRLEVNEGLCETTDSTSERAHQKSKNKPSKEQSEGNASSQTNHTFLSEVPQTQLFEKETGIPNEERRFQTSTSYTKLSLSV
jgi:hypothetical protein